MWEIFAVIVLVGCSALFSGLTIGLMRLNLHELKRKARLGNPDAKRIYPLRKQGNLLLVTLLLGNVAVNAAISLVMRNHTSGIIAGITSTLIIVLFGEILPMAAFHKHAMRFSAKLTWFVRICIIIAYPISKPVALLLDKTFGREMPSPYTQRELVMILEEQHQHPRAEHEHEAIDYAVQGLSFTQRTVREVMRMRGHTFMLNADRELTPNLLTTLRANPYSRIPIYDKERENIIGLLYTKDVALHRSAMGKTLRELARPDMTIVRDTDKLGAVLRKFKRLKQHLFLVHNKEKDVIGIITLEDIVEEITGEIEDEHDS